MAKRNSSQVRGAIAEATVLGELLQCGAAVNSLTMDDSGWDLHLHLPAEPQSRASERGSRDIWELGGHTAHVQVKTRATIKKIQKIQVSGSTARGWISGSQVGTPTFLILVPSTNSSNFAPQYLDPFELSEYVHDTAPSISIPFTGRERFYPESFGYEADLWAHHAPAMFELGGYAKDFVRPRNQDYVETLVKVASVLGAAALMVLVDRPDNDQAIMPALDEITDMLIEGLDHKQIMASAEVRDQLRDAIHYSAQYLSQMWSDPPIPLAVISRSREWSQFRTDLEIFMRRLAKTREAYTGAKEAERDRIQTTRLAAFKSRQK